MANLFDTANPAIQQNMLRDVQEMVRHETGRSIDEGQAARLARTILGRAKSREALYRVSTARLRGLVDKLGGRVAHATINDNGKKTGAQLDTEINDILRARQKREARERSAAPPARSSGVPSEADHERRELASAHKRLVDLRRAPLADRKEAQAAFLETMRDEPDLVAERIGWMLGGSYGHGEKQVAMRVLKNPRMNRSASLTQLIGAFEWQSPEDMSRAAWKKLSKREQAALERAVQAAIKRAESEEP